ncbi:carbohydrate ABC transporter permease [Paenibacillus sacheonensis]|nr:carbohydrate ABC transporter permease [Paenibacillus sacheonensis]MBM7568134.1 ABC-type glycerol-3-phosphate transport system permease component [Paenibacillus sacheonensis]
MTIHLPHVVIVCSYYKGLPCWNQNPKLLPSSLQWDNYSKAWDIAPWGRYFLNTVLYTVCTVLGVLATSFMSGYAFAKLDFKGRDSLFMGYVGTMMIPAQVTIIPVFVILSKLHWVDTYAGLIIPGLTGAFGCFFMRQFIATIPSEIIESGLIDGAGQCSMAGRNPLVGKTRL